MKKLPILLLWTIILEGCLCSKPVKATTKLKFSTVRNCINHLKRMSSTQIYLQYLKSEGGGDPGFFPFEMLHTQKVMKLERLKDVKRTIAHKIPVCSDNTWPGHPKELRNAQLNKFRLQSLALSKGPQNPLCQNWVQVRVEEPSGLRIARSLPEAILCDPSDRHYILLTQAMLHAL